jgi:DNA polymerase-3 subunit alpha (Gram-positive type)
MQSATLLNNVALLDALVGLLETNDRRVSIDQVGQKVFHLRNARNGYFRQVLKQLVKDDPRLVIRDDGFVELLPDERERAPLYHSQFVVVDIETTGIDPHLDRITEVSVFKVAWTWPLERVATLGWTTEGQILGIRRNGWAITDEFTTLINPDKEIPGGITRLTGITNEMVARSPRFAEVADELMDFIGNGVIVAHNAHFDINFINSEINRVYDKRLFNLRLCTVQLSRRLFSELPNHKLHTVAHHLGIDIEDRHRARGDALATAKILLRALDLLEDRGLVTLLDVKEFAKRRRQLKRKT